MSLFDHGETKEFLLFVLNLNMTLAATAKQYMDAKIQYLCMLVRGEALRRLEMENTNTPLTMEYLIEGLA